MAFGSNAAGPNGPEVLLEVSRFYGAGSLFYGTGSLLAEGIQSVGTMGTSYGIPTKGAILNRIALPLIRESASGDPIYF